MSAKQNYVKFKRLQHTVFVTTSLPSTFASLKAELVVALKSMAQNPELLDDSAESIDLSKVTADDIEIGLIQDPAKVIEEAATIEPVEDEDAQTTETHFVWRFKNEQQFQVTPYPEDDDE